MRRCIWSWKINIIRNNLIAVGQRISDLLSDHPDVSAIMITGSTALGHVDEYSDVDIMVLTSTEILPFHDRFTRLSTVGDGWQWDVPTENPIFGTRIDKDGIVNGKYVTVHYQLVPLINDVLHEVLTKGVTSTAHIPFRPYTLVAMLQRCLVLIDKDDLVNRWRSQARQFPIQLKRNILLDCVPSLREATDELVATAERKLGALGFLFHLNHAVDALISILYALNDVYDPADRRAQLVILPTLQYVPRHFIDRFTHNIEGPFDTDGALKRAYAFRELAAEVCQLSEI